jgi:hypothetical protein
LNSLFQYLKRIETPFSNILSIDLLYRDLFMSNLSLLHGYLPEESQMAHSTQRQKTNSYEDLMRPDEDWRSLPDSADRRKIQNRLAQRSYRMSLLTPYRVNFFMVTDCVSGRNVKRQREELEELKLQLQDQSRKLQCKEASDLAPKQDPNRITQATQPIKLASIKRRHCKSFKNRACQLCFPNPPQM